MKINRKDVVIVILLATLGSLFLVYGGKWFNWTELIRGNVSVFVFSLTILYFSFSYDKWKQNKEKEDKRFGILNGIYKEIVERARYLQYYQAECEKARTPYFVNATPFPNSAWESAIANGYYDPRDQSWVDYSYIYSATDNINLNWNRANDIYFKSTVDRDFIDKHLHGIYSLVQQNIPEIMVIINETTTRLENELSISHDQMLEINRSIQERIERTLGNRQQT